MKHALWIILIVTTSVCCSKDDLLEDNTESLLLHFDINNAVWNKSLKSDYTGNTGNNPIPDMVVYGYYTNNNLWSDVRYSAYPSFMDGIVVTNNNGTWSYNPPRYFFPKGKHSFFAYAPYRSIVADRRNIFSIPEERGTPYLLYSLPNETKDHCDLLFGWKTDVTAESSSPVNIQFIHATTKITFSAGIDHNYTLPSFQTVKIKSITFNGIYSSGRVHSEYDASAISGVSWSNLASPKEIYVSTANNTLRDVNLTTTMSQISQEGNALYMIPQPITGRGASETKPSLKLLFEIYNNITHTSQSHTQTFDLSLLNRDWKPGQIFDFQISYNGSGNPITLVLVDPGIDDPDDLNPPLGY